jgi:nicotinamide mononucleotide (NMN) deamidase PncC
MMSEIYDAARVRNLVERLIGSGIKVYLACTGAGAGLANLIWQVPGASATLVGSVFPYAQEEFNHFVGRDWKSTGSSYCSREAAIALAQAAYLRCQKARVMAGDFTSECMGVGLSAAVSTTRTLRGGTRCFGALRTEKGIEVVQINFEQGHLGREGEGAICDLTGLNLITHSLFEEYVRWPNDCRVTSPTISGMLPMYCGEDEVKAGIVLDVLGRPSPLHAQDFSNIIIFPGSFDPLQFGHDEIAKTVATMTEKEVVFEISAENADKATPALDRIVSRAQQFMGRWPVILRTGAKLFIDKVTSYAGVRGFVIGADTAVRILDPKYYTLRSDGVVSALEAFRVHETRFYVVTRRVGGCIVAHRNLWIPRGYEHLFVPVPGNWEISSTMLRDGRSKRPVKTIEEV